MCRPRNFAQVFEGLERFEAGISELRFSHVESFELGKIAADQFEGFVGDVGIGEIQVG